MTPSTPLANYANLKSSDFEASLYRNLKEHGFCIITNHGIPLELLTEIYKEWDAFFQSEKKLLYSYSNVTDEGYVANNVEKAVGCNLPDKKEFFQTHISGIHPDFINLASTQLVVMALVNLAKKIINVIDERLPEEILNQMSERLCSMIENSDRHGFRIIHYPPIKSDDKQQRAAEHGDICLLTLLPSATARGLEIQSNNGKWYAAPTDKDKIIVFNSDMLEMCTSGYIRSTKHRVSANIQPECSSSRYSFPIFIHPRRNVVLKDNITAMEALKARLLQIGYQGNLLKY